MPGISRLDKALVDPESEKIYDLYMQERDNVPNMFRTVAHRPEIFRTMIAHFRAVMNTGTLPAKLKELAIVRTSQINRCEY
jgi:alkylhydroperoxidase family enzyme